jgi:hypothetical protein
MDAVRGGSSVRAAAAQFDVPKSTLSDRVTGRVDSGCKLDRKPVLSETYERRLAENVQACAARGFGYGRSELMRKAGRIAQKFDIINNFSPRLLA